MIELCCGYLSLLICISEYFILERVDNMIIKYSQMHSTDKHSQHSSIIWPVWLNGWVFVYELSGCGFEPRCYHLKGNVYLLFTSTGLMTLFCSYCKSENCTTNQSVVYPSTIKRWSKLNLLKKLTRHAKETLL